MALLMCPPCWFGLMWLVFRLMQIAPKVQVAFVASFGPGGLAISRLGSGLIIPSPSCIPVFYWPDFPSTTLSFSFFVCIFLFLSSATQYFQVHLFNLFFFSFALSFAFTLVLYYDVIRSFGSLPLAEERFLRRLIGIKIGFASLLVILGAFCLSWSEFVTSKRTDAKADYIPICLILGYFFQLQVWESYFQETAENSFSPEEYYPNSRRKCQYQYNTKC